MKYVTSDTRRRRSEAATGRTGEDNMKPQEPPKQSPGPRLIAALRDLRDVLKRRERLGTHYKITTRTKPEQQEEGGAT